MSLTTTKDARPARTVATLALVLAGAALAGCIGDAEAGTATGSFYVKDAPTNELSAVHVTFTRAEAQHADGNWTAFFEGNRTIELLSLNASDARELLGSAELAAGDYTAMRVALSNVTVTDHEGNTTSLLLLNDTVTVSQGFSVTEGGDFAILMDFGLDQGIDLAAGTYTPYVASIQSSQDDSDGDGLDDVTDTDDDGDGIEDALDDDLDGDGEDDSPDQDHGPSERAIGGLCTAWSHGGLGQRAHHAGDDNETDDDNRTERDHPVRAALERFAAADNATVDDFCEDHRHRGQGHGSHDREDEDDDHPGRGQGRGRGGEDAPGASDEATDRRPDADDQEDADERPDDEEGEDDRRGRGHGQEHGRGDDRPGDHP